MLTECTGEPGRWWEIHRTVTYAKLDHLDLREIYTFFCLWCPTKQRFSPTAEHSFKKQQTLLIKTRKSGVALHAWLSGEDVAQVSQWWGSSAAVKQVQAGWRETVASLIEASLMEQEEKWSTRANTHNSLPPHYRVLFTPRLKVCVCVCVSVCTCACVIACVCVFVSLQPTTIQKSIWRLENGYLIFAKWHCQESVLYARSLSLHFFQLCYCTDEASRHKSNTFPVNQVAPRGASWLRWHLAVGDASGGLPFYTSTSLCNHSHQLCFRTPTCTHVHTRACTHASSHSTLPACVPYLNS